MYDSSSTYRLYMMLLGCRPKGRFIEQHDIFFGIAQKPADLIPHIQDYWPEAGGKIHMDGYRPVMVVDGYAVTVTEKLGDEKGTNGPKLFFLNLGGYKPDVFDEFHYKMLTVSTNSGEAIRTARQTAFYKHTGFKDAVSHIDDKYGVDVDDIYEVKDILPSAFRKRFSIGLTPTEENTIDPLRLGYITLEKLKLHRNNGK